MDAAVAAQPKTGWQHDLYDLLRRNGITQIAYVPDAASAIDQLPTWFNRGLAFVILTVLASYIVWVWQRPRVIGRQGWKVTLPGGPLTLLQIGIGIVDLACCALAMFILCFTPAPITFHDLITR